VEDKLWLYLLQMPYFMHRNTYWIFTTFQLLVYSGNFIIIINKNVCMCVCVCVCVSFDEVVSEVL